MKRGAGLVRHKAVLERYAALRCLWLTIHTPHRAGSCPRVRVPAPGVHSGKVPGRRVSLGLSVSLEHQQHTLSTVMVASRR
eukprot:5034351-Prymnesium_polylepis.1